jgi:hypothetical protein
MSKASTCSFEGKKGAMSSDVLRKLARTWSSKDKEEAYARDLHYIHESFPSLD